MSNLVDTVLDQFKQQNISEGGALNKSVILDVLKSSGADMNAVRNAWHQLMGEGLIVQSGDNIVLTARGASKIK